MPGRGDLPEDALPQKWEPFVKINYAFGEGADGVHDGDHGPFRRSPENERFCRGKSRKPVGSVPFGGSNGLVCLFFTAGTSTATTGAWPSPTIRVSLPGGPRWR